MSIPGRAVIFFIIFLVVSLTPVGAVQTASAMNNDKVENIENSIDKNADDLEILSDQMNDHGAVITDDWNYVKSNWWKFWRWGKVNSRLNDINDQTNQIKPITDQINVKSQKLVQDINELDVNTNNSLDTNLTSTDSYKNAQSIVNILQKRNISAEIKNPNNFKEGDIVQYKSQGKYYRYLEFVKIDNQTNFVILKNKNNGYIALSQEYFNKTATLRITSTSSNEIYKPVNEVIQEQLNDMYTLSENKKATANKLNETANGILPGWIAFMGAFIYVGLPLSAVFPPAGIPLAIAFFTAFVACFTPWMVLDVKKNNMMDSSISLKNQANNIKKDLNNYPNSFPMVGNMNITTSVGMSVNGTLNATDWDGKIINYTIVKQPEHGILNLTNGSFVYTPNGNYSGNDTFKYSVNDGVVDSNVADVYINVTTIKTHLTMGNITGKVGQRVNLTVILADDHGVAIAGRNVLFKVNGTIVGNATTNENGTAVLRNFLLRNPGKFIINALFKGDPMYKESNITSILNILKK